jgi:plasmid maintenance system killer protein
MSKFNFKKSPVSSLMIEHGELYVEIPLYNSLLGNEDLMLQNLENEQAKQQQKLLVEIQEIAVSRNLNASLIMQALNSGDTEYLSENLPVEDVLKLTRIVENFSNPRQKELKYVVEFLKRVDPEISMEEIKDLPITFIDKILNVFYQEGSHKNESYAELAEKLARYIAICDASKAIIDTTMEVLPAIKDEKIQAQVSNLSEQILNFRMLTEEFLPKGED